MAVKKGQLVELEVTGIAFGGRGLARVNGLAVFVDQAVPGDRVLARIIKKKRSYAEARVDTLQTPSDDRVEPPCPYSGYCGGCKWQFLNYAVQLDYKRQHVQESLEHIGLIKGVPVHPTIPSELDYGYRNKMEFSCSDRRWLLPQEMGIDALDTTFALGLHVPGTFYKVLDTQACLLQPSLGNQILEDVRRYMRHSKAPVYGLRSHVGFWRFLMLRHSVAYDQWMVNLITAAEDETETLPLADQLMHKYPQVVSVVNNVTSRKAGVATGEYEVPLAGATSLNDKIGPYEFEISANSFFQTNTRGADRLYRTTREYVRLTGKETVFDLYSGTGTIAIYLSDLAAQVIGFEIVESAVADARKNVQSNHIANCEFVLGDIRNSLARADTRPDVMVIDPPRSGMHKDVLQAVLNSAPARIVYVSCNPATLARDLAMMQADYHVAEVQPIDMFPHTYHVEAVARLEKKT